MNIFRFWNWKVRKNKKIVKASNKSLKELRASNEKLKWNIYNWKTFGQSLKGESIVHGIFKYRFWVPLLILGDRIIKKVVVKNKKDLTNEWYDEELVLFDEMFDKSIHDWVHSYLYCSRGYSKLKKKLMTKEQIETAISSKPSCKLLRTMKNLVLTMVKYDTAYREFLIVFLHNLAIELGKKYQGKTVRHLIYDTASVYNVDYYYLGRILKEKGIIKNVSYSYEIQGQIQVQPIAKEIIMEGILTDIKPQKINIPEFNKEEYDKLVKKDETRFKKGKKQSKKHKT